MNWLEWKVRRCLWWLDARPWVVLGGLFAGLWAVPLAWWVWSLLSRP